MERMYTISPFQTNGLIMIGDHGDHGIVPHYQTVRTNQWGKSIVNQSSVGNPSIIRKKEQDRSPPPPNPMTDIWKLLQGPNKTTQKCSGSRPQQAQRPEQFPGIFRKSIWKYCLLCTENGLPAKVRVKTTLYVWEQSSLSSFSYLLFLCRFPGFGAEHPSCKGRLPARFSWEPFV